MTLIKEFRPAVQGMIGYIRETELEDFIEQIERFELDGTYPAGHVFMDAFTADKALTESVGEEPETLGEALASSRGESISDYAKYFQCQNPDCGYIGTKTDPMSDSLLLALAYNEPIPAGLCPHCADIVRAI